MRKKVVGLSESGLNRFALAAGRAAGLKGIVNVLVTSSTAMRSLNQKFRGNNQTTDVLSFPASVHELDKPSRLAGEIAISADTAIQNALRLGHTAAQEVKVLTLHGILHLAGFDHERDNGEMARRETDLREKLGLPTGLIERASRSGGRRSNRRGTKTGARRTA